MSRVNGFKATCLSTLAAACISFICVAPAAAVPIDYVVSGTGSFQVGSTNSGGTFAFTFDGGDTSNIGAVSGGFQYANNPMSATVTLTNGSGLFYSGSLSNGSDMVLNQPAGLIVILDAISFGSTFGFSDPALTSATLDDIGFSVTIVPSTTAILSALPSLLPVQNGDGSTFLTLQSVTGLTFSEEAGTVAATPLPAALPLFATGLGALGLLVRSRKRKAAAPTA